MHKSTLEGQLQWDWEGGSELGTFRYELGERKPDCTEAGESTESGLCDCSETGGLGNSEKHDFATTGFFRDF